MVKQESKMYKKNSNGVRNSISSNWGILLTGMSLVGSSFLAGIYIEKSLSDIRHNDEITRLNEKIIDIKTENEKEMHELRQELYNTQNEIITIRQNKNEK